QYSKKHSKIMGKQPFSPLVLIDNRFLPTEK
ncbi:unnamed protein product, partial [marine sediment metagenome]